MTGSYAGKPPERGIGKSLFSPPVEHTGFRERASSGFISENMSRTAPGVTPIQRDRAAKAAAWTTAFPGRGSR
jgi:hypothetical protein